MNKVIRLKGNMNKVYFPSAIVSIEHVTIDRHGNVYTEIIFANDSSIKVSDHIDGILDNLNNLEGDLLLEGYQYKVNRFVK